ncbi:hypothetical protein WJX73_009964 [Symbiochloris irregularis]|uniref:FAS1 domain-containing protein n=1 Tax=Symbiochloris irregularis TaxID=706552 RepID=A0AAW1PAA6_9CHLO
MKAALFALALIATCAESVHASGRTLQQRLAPAPAPCMTVAELAQQAGLTSLLRAAELDNLTESLSDPELAYTIFAPTNEAFTNGLVALGRTDLQDVLFNSELDPLLQYHFLITPLDATQLVEAGTEATNYLNETLSFSPDGSTVSITAFASNATVVSANNVACNSIVHIIDGVLVPQFFLPDFDVPASAPVAQAV